MNSDTTEQTRTNQNYLAYLSNEFHDDDDSSSATEMNNIGSRSSEIDRNRESYEKYIAKGKNLIDVSWTRTRIGSAEEDSHIAVNVLTMSRHVKGLDESPHNVFFRTHQYEFRIIPNDEFFNYTGMQYGYILEMTLYRKRDSDSVVASGSSKVHIKRESEEDDEEAGGDTSGQQQQHQQHKQLDTRLAELDQFDIFTNCGQPIILVSMQEDVDTGTWLINMTWTKNTRINLKGDFCLRLDCYRKVDGETFKRVFSMVSNCFTILSKPLVYALRKKSKKKRQGREETSKQAAVAALSSSKSSKRGKRKYVKEEENDVDSGDGATGKRNRKRSHQHTSSSSSSAHGSGSTPPRRGRSKGGSASMNTHIADGANEKKSHDAKMKQPYSKENKRRRLEISAEEAPEIDLINTEAYDLEDNNIREDQMHQCGEPIEMGCGLSVTKTSGSSYLFTGIGGAADIGEQFGGMLSSTEPLSDSLNAMLESFLDKSETTNSREISMQGVDLTDAKYTLLENDERLNTDISRDSTISRPSSRQQIQKAKQVMAKAEEESSPSLFSFQNLQSTAGPAEALSFRQDTNTSQGTAPLFSPTTFGLAWIQSPLFSPLHNLTGSATATAGLGVLSALTTSKGLLSLPFGQSGAEGIDHLFNFSQFNSSQQSQGGDQDLTTESQQFDHLWQAIAVEQSSSATILPQQDHDDGEDGGDGLFNSQRSFYGRYLE